MVRYENMVLSMDGTMVRVMDFLLSDLGVAAGVSWAVATIRSRRGTTRYSKLTGSGAGGYDTPSVCL